MTEEEFKREVNRSENNQRAKKWAKAHPEKRKATQAKWNKKNRNEYQKAYRKRYILKGNTYESTDTF